MRKLVLCLLFVLFIPYSVYALDVCGFEIFNLEDNENLESAEATGFTCKDFTFSYNGEDSEYGFYWNGFSYSTWRDTYTSGIGNQYSAITKYGYDKSDTYCIAYPDAQDTITLETEAEISGFYITNTTYAFYSMKEGDQFTKVFGGQSGEEKDFFKVIIKGYDAEGGKTGEKEFYLADFRFDDNSSDYIVDEWEWVDLSVLGSVKKLQFAFDSSDKSEWGINTPTYFAMDNLNGEPPASDDSDSSAEISCFISSFSKQSLDGYFYAGTAVFLFFILISLRIKKNEE
jgi:hypothetical protein